MIDVLKPPPEATLIRELREQAPHMSMRQAADAAGISHTRWRQIENGIRHFRGQEFSESGPARTVAVMAKVVGATPGQLDRCGRPDAAAELRVLAETVEHGAALTGRQSSALAARVRRDSGAS